MGTACAILFYPEFPLFCWDLGKKRHAKLVFYGEFVVDCSKRIKQPRQNHLRPRACKFAQ